MSNPHEPSSEEVKRLCADGRTDTLIFIVSRNTNLCAQLLGVLRSPDILETSGAARFELGWSLYEKQYAGAGGVFGALLCRGMKKNGPIMLMGEADQLAFIAKTLSLRARELTRGTLTPIYFERAFEATVHTVTAEISLQEGHG
jgi:hypothetical protein